MNVPHDSPIVDMYQRERIRTELDKNMLVEAAAGTGKTTSIVERMKALLQQGRCAIAQLVAVTFTRKAAAELRERFFFELEASISNQHGVYHQRLIDALQNAEQGFIGTIHAFCARLLRERPFEAGVDISFEEIDEQTDLTLRKEAWRIFLKSTSLDTADPAIQALDDLGIGLSDLEDAFFTYTDYPDVDSWPAGKGREVTIIDEAHQKVLVEYLEHLSRLEPGLPVAYGRDKLIPAIRKLCRQAKHLNMQKNVDLISLLETFEPNAPVVKNVWPDKKIAQQEKDLFEQVRTEIARVALSTFRTKRYQPILDIMQRAAVTYNRLRRDLGVLNFQDLLSVAADMLQRHPHVRAYFQKRYTHILVDEFQDTDPLQAKVLLLLTSRSFVTQNPSGWSRLQPAPGALFVVGDPKQSIYRFRRADITIYNRVKQILERDAPPVELSVNFRTEQPVLDWINQTFTGMFPKSATDLSPSYLAIQRGRKVHPNADLSGVWSLDIPKDFCTNTSSTIEYEADLIARFIRNALDRGLTLPGSPRETSENPNQGVSNQVRKARACDFMIITYTKSHLSIYAKVLQTYGIPHEVTGGSVLNQTSELGLLHSALEATVKPDNPVAFLAVLRSELFGISDRMLYLYKAAGGRFDYRSEQPDALPEEIAERFEDVTSRLRRYSRWLDEIGGMPAIERMVADLGLTARAAIGPKGSIQAGSLYKALELMRAAKSKTAGPTELLEYLAKLVDHTLPFDGMSARSQNDPAVRLMNLHKAKGLEAPVVFLAGPTGGKPKEPHLHIDRIGTETKGYMSIEKSTLGFYKKPIAHPADWIDGLGLKQIEHGYQQAELMRLLYVAATRAGSMLVITQKAARQDSNLWSAFAPYLQACKKIDDPGPQSAPQHQTESTPNISFEQAEQNILNKLETLKRPTYSVRTARQIALDSQPDTFFVQQETWQGERDQGSARGRVIHALLEAAMKDIGKDLSNLANTLILEEDLDQEWTKEVLCVVQSVIRSDLWKRAKESLRFFAEAPFVIPWKETQADTGATLPGVLRGVIDLVFEETDGWVVVDYKTDRVNHQGLEKIIEKYAPQVRLYAQAWSMCTKQTIKEMGLYFTALDLYIAL